MPESDPTPPVLTVEEALRSAIGHHRAGRLQEAERIYRIILEAQPSHSDANHNLGVIALHGGRVDIALPLFKAALEANLSCDQYWVSYIETLIAAGRIEDAAELLEQGRSLGFKGEAVDKFEALHKSIVESKINKAKEVIVCAFEGRDFEEAERLSLEMTRDLPNVAFGWKALGAAKKQLGRIAEALEPMQRAIQLMPDDFEAHKNLGVLQNDLGTLIAAEASLRRAIAIKPDYAEALNNLGATLHKLGRFNEAEIYYRQAISNFPEYYQAYNNLGVTLDTLGRQGEAVDCYQRAISIKPDYAECHRNLSQLKTYGKHDPHIASLQEVLETTSSEDDRIHASFALGKAYEDQKRYDEAFALYQAGNSLRRRQLAYSIDRDRQVFERTKAAFYKLPAVEPVMSKGAKAVLIVGMPRSGSSLVEQILASHSAVHGAGELETLNLLVEKYFPNAAGFDLSGAAHEIASGYFGKLGKIAEGRAYVTDKMPINFRWLGFLLLANPEIRVVHTMRDPIATCWSNFKLYFPAVKDLEFTHDLNDLAAYYKLYQDLMAFWHEKFPGRIYDLEYERLTEHQEEETRKLLDYCGLEWEEGCLDFHETNRAVRTASASQVRKKLYQGSSEAWRKFEKHLQPLKKGLA